jgi:hypothetical protein
MTVAANSAAAICFNMGVFLSGPFVRMTSAGPADRCGHYAQAALNSC